MTRFRGMISTQPGSTPLSSFKIVSLEEEVPSLTVSQSTNQSTKQSLNQLSLNQSIKVPSLTASHGNDIGPYGDQDDELVFIQKLVPETDVLTVRLASRGTRVAEVRIDLYSSVSTSLSLDVFSGSQCGWFNYNKLLCARV